jgi:hypothetical protein
MLAFYCIIGGEHPLPAARWVLYRKVVVRMLSGAWRGSDGDDRAPQACVAVLRGWAWLGATCDEATGLGTWTDEIRTPRCSLSLADQKAIEHVAGPLGKEDFDSGLTLRRFVHRSVREYLTAEYIAVQMDAGEAARELLKHLWYDRDWEYAAPAALAMHPRRDEVLAALIRIAARSEQVPDDLAGIDGCWELRRFLAHVATESREADWMAESVAMITRARLDLAANGVADGLRSSPGWVTSDGQVRKAVLARLIAAARPFEARSLAEALARLSPEPGDLARARAKLLTVLTTVDPDDALMQAKAVAQLSRRNSTLSSWLEVLPALVGLPATG